jgi:hypothetical protein
MVCPDFEFIIYLSTPIFTQSDEFSEVSGYSWQLIAAVHDEGDDLTLGKQLV